MSPGKLWQQIKAQLGGHMPPIDAEGDRIVAEMGRLLMNEDTDEQVRVEIAQRFVEWGRRRPKLYVGPLMVAASNTTSAQLCEVIAESQEAAVCASLAANPNIPENAQMRIVDELRPGWPHLITNPSTTARALERIAEKGRWIVMRIDFLKHPNCPENVAEQIWEHQLGDHYIDYRMHRAMRAFLERNPQAWAIQLSYNLHLAGVTPTPPPAQLENWMDEEQLRQAAELTKGGWAASLDELLAVVRS